MSTSYWPTGKLGKEYDPALLVETRCRTPVAVWVAAMVARGTEAPLPSVTVPEMPPPTDARVELAPDSSVKIIKKMTDHPFCLSESISRLTEGSDHVKTVTPKTTAAAA